MNLLKSIGIILLLTRCIDSANILSIIPFSAPSHYIAISSIGLELARRGHNVTVITTLKEKNPPSNYNQICADDKQIWDVLGGERPNIFTMANMSSNDFQHNILRIGGLAMTEVAFNSTSVKEFLKKDNKFDLVISEQFYQEAFNILAYKYNAPLALVTTFGNCMRHNIVTRNPLQLATVVSEHLHVEDPTSFLGRLNNFYHVVLDYVIWRFWYLPKQELLIHKYLPELVGSMPSLYDMQKDASLLLSNGHFSYDTPMALLPNIVEIGGIHLTESKGILPGDLQKILDESKHGVVYVNFGSNVRSSELPVENKIAFLNVFKHLKQTVLWKWEEDSLEGKPSNVIIRKWFPQKEILAHGNIKVFISHGGLIGTQEAVYNGVPIIGVPIYADQYNNLLLIEQAGAGKILQLQHINEKNLQSALDDILNNDMFMKSAKDMSQRFKDRPMTPIDTAIYWLEYVIRNKGAHYMKNPARDLSWITYNMIDIYTFITFIFVFCIVIIFKVVAVFKNILGRKKKSKTM